MPLPATTVTLLRDLRALGVAPGDLLFIHSSFKSLGPLEDGATTVVEALVLAVGYKGLLLMPSFNLIEGGIEARAAAWDRATTPSTVGWLTEFFRQLPATVRSDHYSHSVAALGHQAAAFVEGHRSPEGLRSPWDLEPWGATYGKDSPMLRAYRHPHAKLLMLGVDYHSSTYLHLVEVIDWNRRLRRDPNASYYWIDRDRAGAWWDAHGERSTGFIAEAHCRLFSIRDYVDTLTRAVEAHPANFFKHYPS